MLNSHSSKNLQAGSVPWKHAVEKLFSPLIETQKDPEDPQDSFCGLFHNTVRSFLLDNTDIFHQESSNEGTYLITEAALGTACLRYLGQEKYAQLLIKADGCWLTSSKENVKDHHLLTYSAKYWDRHLDGVKESSELGQLVQKFIQSINFPTSLQVQSLFVEGRFEIYTIRGHAASHKFTKLVLPRQIAASSLNGSTTIAQDYRTFISEWQTLLHYATCKNDHCRLAGFPGELDRCLWKALGSQNFLSSNKGRYNDFLLGGQEGMRHGKESPYHEGIAMSGSEIVVVHSSNTE